MHDRTNTTRTRRDLFGGALFAAGLAATASAQTSFTTSTLVNNVGSLPDGTIKALRVADVNNDGALDFLYLLPSGAIAVHRNDGAADPVFTPESLSSIGRATNVLPADLNGDGAIDLAWVNSYTCISEVPGNCDFQVLAWSRNLGAPAFPLNPLAFTIAFEGDAGTFGYDAVAWGDLDGDGSGDLVATSSGQDTIVWIPQPTQFNAPTFVLDNTLNIFGPGDLASRIEVVDLDDDGDNDVLVAAQGGLYWLENDGNPTPSFITRTLGATNGLLRIDPIDVNGDGDIDVAFASSIGEIGYFLSDGQFNPSFSKVVVDTAPDFTDIDAHDMDLDGDVDIVTSIPGVEVRWYESDGQPTPGFTPHQILILDPEVPVGPPDFIFVPADATDARLVVADYDGDGDPDILHALRRDGIADIVVHENDFDPTAPIVIQDPKDQLVQLGAAANFDVVVVGSDPKSYQWRRNGVDLVDGPGVSGATTDVLTITAATTAAGFYECEVVNQFGMATSQPGLLAVAFPGSQCPGDLNGDGATNVFDFSILAADFGCETD